MEKILITSDLYRPNIGGIENSLYFLSLAYLRAGYEVHLVTSTINKVNDIALPLYEEIDDIKIFRYEGKSFFQRNRNAIKLFRKLLTQNQYKIFIARFHIPLLMLKLVGAQNLVYVLPGISFEQDKFKIELKNINSIKRVAPYYFHHMMQCFAIRLADKNYVFSENMILQVKKFLKYDKNIRLTKPGIDNSRFSPPSIEVYNQLRAEYDYDISDIILLGVGRFYDVKGFEYLIESLEFLPSRFKLLLVGDGDNRDKYKEIIKSKGLSSRVKIIGPVQDTSSFYKVSDIFVMSSVHEPFGQTILEALASGLPIVAFDSKIEGILTATNEITSFENSVFTKVLSAEYLAKSILDAEKLIKNGYFNKNEISKSTTSNYSWDSMAKDLIK